MLGYAAGLGLAWAALATLLVGPAAWLDWLAVVRRTAGEFGALGVFPERMYNLKALLTGLLGPGRAGAINALSLAALAAALLVTALVFRGRWLAGSRFQLRWALCLQLGLLTNPHLNPADALAYVLPAVLYCASARRGGWFAATAGLLVACPLVFLVDCYGVERWPGGVRPFFVAMVMLPVAIRRG
jgi:hypothetical protein